MANTTNLNLGKLGGSEKLKTYPTTQAGNMDIIDSAFGAGFGVSGAPSVNTSINNLADGLAIVANGNTHAAITSGQYVYVRNHGSLSEGLYVATANISANGTLSGSNLTADTDGGLNSVYASLNSKLSTTSPTVTKTANIKTNSVVSAKRNANVVSIYMDVYAASTSSDYVSIASLSEAPSTNVYFVMIDVNDGAKMCRLTSGGLLQIHGTVADKNYMGSLTYIVNS